MEPGKRREVDKRIDDIEEKLDHLHNDVRELIEMWTSAKGFVAVVSWTGTVVKWFAMVGLASAAVWTFLKTGHWK